MPYIIKKFLLESFDKEDKTRNFNNYTETIYIKII